MLCNRPSSPNTAHWISGVLSKEGKYVLKKNQILFKEGIHISNALLLLSLYMRDFSHVLVIPHIRVIQIPHRGLPATVPSVIYLKKERERELR